MMATRTLETRRVQRAAASAIVGGLGGRVDCLVGVIVGLFPSSLVHMASLRDSNA